MKRLSVGADRIMGEAAFEVLAKARALERQGKKILHFEIGEPDFETPQYIKDAAIEALEEDQTHYVPSIGTLELREAVVREVERTRGYRPELEQVMVIPGAKPGIYYTMVTTVNDGDEVIYPDPGFPTYESMTRTLGAKPVPLPLLEENEFRMNPDDIRARVTDRTKLIIVNSPQNPTGSAMTKGEIEEVARIAEEHDIFLFSDEIYSKMLYGGEHHSPTKLDEAKERSILMDGFSKAFAMTGWRLGYIVAPPELTEKMTLFLTNSVSCTNAFIQHAGAVGLDGDLTFVDEMMAQFTERREVIVKGLNAVPGFSCLYPGGAFYAFPNIQETGMTSAELADYLMNEAGVACLPGTAFGPYGEGYLRFSFASSLDNIRAAMEKVKAAMEKRQG